MYTYNATINGVNIPFTRKPTNFINQYPVIPLDKLEEVKKK